MHFGATFEGEAGLGPDENGAFEVDDVGALLAHLEQNGATITGGPSFDKQSKFWFGSFSDPEGNPVWVVDTDCP